MLCPGINNGSVLERTCAEILARYPRLATVGIVPLGLSRFNTEERLTVHTPEEAKSDLEIIHFWQDQAEDRLGRRMFFASDELYLRAGRSVPDSAAYEGFLQHENGIGMIRAFYDELDRLERGSGGGLPLVSGEWRSIPAAPDEGYRAVRHAGGDPSTDLGGPVVVITGEYGAAALEPVRSRLEHLAGRELRLLPVKNEFFGGNTAVTGLLVGADVRQCSGTRRGPAGVYLLPDVALSGDVFLDDVPLDDVAGAAKAPRPRRRSERAGPDRGGRRMSATPVVAILGRPNVGKSTLVNRIVRRKAAVVDEQAGVTRDRREFDAEWQGRAFTVIDTGGWEFRPNEQLTADIKEQAEIAARGADLVIFVADATSEVGDDDVGVARVLQRSEVPYLFVANKVDSPNIELTLDHLWALGLGEPIPVSALHGRNTGDFLDRLVDALPDVDRAARPDAVATLAIVGRPNVGKSTLLNKLAGEERVLVSEVPGTTRDPINLVVDFDGEPFEIIDTAGIKRRTRIKDDVEFYSVLRARRLLGDVDVTLLMVDGTRGATHQEQRLAEEIADAGSGLIVLLNKWDTVDEDERLHTEDSVADRLAFVGWAPVLRLSARTGAR